MEEHEPWSKLEGLPPVKHTTEEPTETMAHSHQVVAGEFNPCGKITLDDPEDFLIYRPGSGNTIEIFDVVVASRRRKGKGKAMVEYLLAIRPGNTRLVWAITRATNQIAQCFYEGIGFRVVGVLRDFYRDEPGREGGVDGVIYGRDVE